MKNLKSYFKLVPEIYFLISVLFYWFSAAVFLNPVAITLMVIFILQLIFQNKSSGIIIALFLLPINLYMILAIVSEFNKFPVVNAEAKTLLCVGLLYFGLNIAMGIVMCIKYFSGNTEKISVSINQ